jgi:hypothetical protein
METALIEKRAKQILRSAGVKEAPVDLERLLAYLRLHHERPWHLSSDVWDALTRGKRGRTRITGQERRLTARGRWRLAHEIGHHVVHGSLTPGRGTGDWQRNETEHEADLFAAEILMPASLVEKAVQAQEKEGHPLDVEELARGFKVGRQEMEKRLRQLGLLKREIPGRM